jgi:hypothetical protein
MIPALVSAAFAAFGVFVGFRLGVREGRRRALAETRDIGPMTIRVNASGDARVGDGIKRALAKYQREAGAEVNVICGVCGRSGHLANQCPGKDAA